MIFSPFAFQQQVVSVGPTPTPTATATPTPSPTPTATPTPTPEPLPSGIIMYYDAGNELSYPGTGTTITDLSGNGYTATMNVNNGYSSSDGGYWTFNGNNGVSITGGTLNETLTEWSMWSAIYKTQDGFYDGIMFERTGPGNANGLGFFASTGRLNLLVNNGTEIPAATGSSDVVKDAWALVAGGVDNTTWFRQVYRDGVQYWASGTKSAGSSNFNDPIVLGQDRETGTDRTMAGRIAISIMWDRKLSQEEITQVNDYFKSRYGI
jgi:hypothetical protein